VYQALEQRLAAEPQVIGVTHGGALPGMNERELLIEVEGVGASAPATTLRVKTTTIDVGLPNLFGVPIVAGRAFTRSDTNSARHVAIVDQAFVRHVLGGRDAIGLRVREASRDRTEPAPWVEIVGVVRNVTSEVNESADDAVLYRPGTAGEVYPVRMAVRVNAEAKTIMARLQNLAATVDPALRLDEVMTLDEAASLDRVAIDFFLRVLAGIAAVALLLSTAGVYALMSFTVARRTPDIAIRLALGAEAHRVLLGTFAHALMQVMLGVIVGCLAGGAIVFAVEPELVAQSPAVIAIGTCVAVTAFMAAVTMLAGLAPARRALRIQPADALKTN
jgi:hypothetical protein